MDSITEVYYQVVCDNFEKVGYSLVVSNQQSTDERLTEHVANVEGMYSSNKNTLRHLQSDYCISNESSVAQ